MPTSYSSPAGGVSTTSVTRHRTRDSKQLIEAGFAMETVRFKRGRTAESSDVPPQRSCRPGSGSSSSNKPLAADVADWLQQRGVKHPVRFSTPRLEMDQDPHRVADHRRIRYFVAAPSGGRPSPVDADATRFEAIGGGGDYER